MAGHAAAELCSAIVKAALQGISSVQAWRLQVSLIQQKQFLHPGPTLRQAMGHPAKTKGKSAIPSVLVVDDDRTFADVLVSLLSNDGLKANAAYSGPQAIEYALKSLPDFVVLDVMMDGIDGVDTAIAISETMPAPRILLMSGHPDAKKRLEKGAVRGHDFELLTKPIQFASLLQKLRSPQSESRAA